MQHHAFARAKGEWSNESKPISLDTCLMLKMPSVTTLWAGLPQHPMSGFSLNSTSRSVPRACVMHEQERSVAR